ncbi:MAG: hypothetical protein A3B86_00200 [Candidatus Yanofskybacteria bacterium RIFCSPHIGHO2_02_FULL_38_22b]|uniref:DUF5671 domain-containing protein n=1 Tax=Candidatus Yanofskybacteria bacterium RIFCSPHIGHO2_02_FULL_38_22b TaxID=1802673 RepID=A0A1F8F1M0_9BACT|nr:MAG: hypothetical protein A3B86_00200 [Candidatus Yanofskybacteria bacterium RIFCSPHIGHO2_02_FULL_38_22b]
MSPLSKAIRDVVVLILLAILFVPLFLIAFYADSNSYTMNFIGKLMFIPYGIFILIFLKSLVMNIKKIGT